MGIIIMKPQILFALIFTFLLLSSSNWLAYASNNDPYQSSYDHGCADAGVFNPSDRYTINQKKDQHFILMIS
jgi:hypothetical protein